MTPPTLSPLPPPIAIANLPQRRTRYIVGALIGFLLLVILFETIIIVEQKRVSQKIEAQTDQALGKFLKQERPADTGAGTDIMFRNVRFCWSQNVCINTPQLTATAIPMTQGGHVVFDNIKNILVAVHNANVFISPKTLQGMFNESVFNYPGSNLRDLTVGIEKTGSANHIKLTGSLKYFLWIPFEMDTNLSVDQKNNALVISVNTLKVFGFIPATWLIEFKPFNLDKLLTLPPNRYLTVYHNLMLVKPFGLFPPPRISGKMASIAVMRDLILLRFSGTDPAFAHIPQPSQPNFIYLQGGNAQFGRIQMLDTQLQVNDQNTSDFFKFSLLNYQHYLPLSQVRLQESGAVVVQMPDHKNIPDMGGQIDHGANTANLQDATSAPGQKQNNAQKPGFWHNVKTKFHEWFGI
jgi:hypothetical protein